MELAIPLVALSGLYIVSQNSKKKSSEPFTHYKNAKKTDELPNTDQPNKNYPIEYPINPTTQEIDQTSKLSVTYKYDSPSVYTDKYFNQDTYKQDAGDTFTSMTGDKVNKDYFNHNNMTPYFGAKNRSTILDPESTEGLIDNYTGAGTQNISKIEQSPLFIPGENYHFTHGAPNSNDFFQSRVNQSMRMANTKPFESQNVGPGMGLGSSNEGKGGYNAGMDMREAWMPKTVDEMRTDNNRRAGGIGMLGREGPANSMIKNTAHVGTIGKLEKNRVDRAWENGPERYFTTTGQEKGQTLRAIPVDRDVSRPETSMSYTGVAGSCMPEMYTTGEYFESKHMDLGPIPIGVASAVGRKEATTGDFEALGKKAYPNNRMTTGDETYFGAFGGAIGAVIAPLLDELRPSRKEPLGTMRPYHNAQSKVASSYLFNPGDRPAPTIREMTEKNNFVSGVNKNQHGGAYTVTDHQAYSNVRDSTHVSYSGNAASRGKAAMPYDAAFRQTNNEIKSSTIVGHMVPGSTNMLNSTINQRNRNGEIQNVRPVSKTNAPNQLYGVDMMGQAHSKQQYNQVERNGPEMLTAFKNNPYTHSLTNVP